MEVWILVADPPLFSWGLFPPQDLWVIMYRVFLISSYSLFHFFCFNCLYFKGSFISLCKFLYPMSHMALMRPKHGVMAKVQATMILMVVTGLVVVESTRGL